MAASASASPSWGRFFDLKGVLCHPAGVKLAERAIDKALAPKRNACSVQNERGRQHEAASPHAKLCSRAENYGRLGQPASGDQVREVHQADHTPRQRALR